MKEQYSANVERWPEVGCGARFVPWARGASMVVEMQMIDRTWAAFMADRFPDVLEKEIQKVREAFYLTVQKLEPEELRETLPRPALSMTHLCDCLLYTSDAADDM
eukprot:10319612-Prorocentrum_lima.AAC.1